jgi:hypothetical protein
MARSPKTNGRTGPKPKLRTGFHHNLPVKLTEDQLVARRQELLERLNEVDKLEDELKAHNKRTKDIIAGVRADVRRLRNVLEDGSELQQVECREVANWDQGIIETFRCDTDELVTELGHREITPEERQNDIEDDGEE